MVVIWRALRKWKSTATIYTVWFMWYWISLLALCGFFFPILFLCFPHSAALFLSDSLYSFFPHSFWQAFNFTLGGAEWGEGQGCVNRGQHFFFSFSFFLLIQGEWREKERPKCPFSSLLCTYTYFSLLSHTLADTDSFPRVFSLQLSCLAEQQELLVKMTFHL